MGDVFVIGTGDTKSRELEYVKSLIEATGVSARFVDVGTSGHESAADVTPDEVASFHPDGPGAVASDDRGTAVAAMSVALEQYVIEHADEISGVIGAGGSGGTALVTTAMRALPVGIPKMMVSTVASSNVAPYVGPADIAMMYSVTDVAGLNRISRQVLGNAAHAIAGMVANTVPASTEDRDAVGLTMFGVTTPLVTKLVEELEADHDPLVFHATGTGGQSMEKLVESGLVAGVLDMTTTEVADFLVGGVFPCLPERFDVIAQTGVPYVVSVGAVDMVNFGAVDTVPEAFSERKLHVHNPQVTLMRTTADENRQIGEFLATKLNACDGPVRLLLPEGGVSLIDAPGQPFHDPEADAALFDAIENTLVQTANRTVTRVPGNINDDVFVRATLDAFGEVMNGSQR